MHKDRHTHRPLVAHTIQSYGQPVVHTGHIFAILHKDAQGCFRIIITLDANRPSN